MSFWSFGLEFPDLGMVNLELNHPVTSVDGFLEWLEEYNPSN